MLRLFRKLILISLTLATIVVEGKNNQGSGSPSLAAFTSKIPVGSKISVPTGLKLKYIAIGTGTQNYKCAPTSPTDKTLTWLYQGAVAVLRDASKEPSNAAKVVNDYEAAKRGKGRKPVDLSRFPVLGEHSFVLYAEGGAQQALLPKFDFSTSMGQKGEASFLIAKKVAASPSPLHPERNVDWLQLQRVKGQLAQAVLRKSTRGGTAPKRLCKVGEAIASEYAAVYEFYG